MQACEDIAINAIMRQTHSFPPWHLLRWIAPEWSQSVVRFQPIRALGWGAVSRVAGAASA
jgi:hypothetical protein